MLANISPEYIMHKIMAQITDHGMYEYKNLSKNFS